MPNGFSASIRSAASPVALRIDQPTPPVTAMVRAVLGGGQVASVQTHIDGDDVFAHKQLDRAQPEDITVQVGSTIPSRLFDWIAASWGAKPPSRNGALLRCDPTYTIRRETPFRAALVAETSFPALDAASAEPGRLAIRLVPTTSGPDSVPGTKLQVALAKGAAKVWLAANFRLQLDGLDCTKVSRIEPFAIRRRIDVVQTGVQRSLEPGPVDFPNLRVLLSLAGADTWYAWHQSFVVEGKNGDTFEKSGAISLLSPDLATELARIELHGVGITRLSSDPPELGASVVPRLTADLYCERMALVAGANP